MTSLPQITFTSVFQWLRLFGLFPLLFSGIGQYAATSTNSCNSVSETKHHKVLILGGGVAGVIAACTLHQNGIDDFLIVDALDELGGRMMNHRFAGKTIELGANWVQGAQVGDGPANPIFELAKKHNITIQFNEWYDSISTWYFLSLSTGSLDSCRDLCCSYL